MSIAADPAAADPAPGSRFPPEPGDFAELRDYAAAAEDEVLRCEECTRILIRTEQSGL